MMRGIALAVWLATLPLAGQAQPRFDGCRVEPWSTTNESPAAATTMTVQRERSCTIIMRRRVASERVTERPSSGVVSIVGAGLVYRPRAGFVGEDRFVYEALLPENDPDVTQRRRTLTVNVIVQSEPVAAGASQSPPNWPVCFARPLREAELAAVPASGALTQLMQLRTGGRCGVTFDAGVQLAEDGAPQNGTLTIEASRITYVPRRDFRGRDEFSFRWTRGTEQRRYRFLVEIR